MLILHVCFVKPLETINHLFFKCPFSMKVWEALMKGVMKNQYTMEWASIIRLVTEGSHWSKVQMFMVRYILQSTVHTIWRERNRRRHGEASTPLVLLVKRIDKNMRNRFRHSAYFRRKEIRLWRRE